MHLTVNAEIDLRTWSESDAPALFALIEKNRSYLERWLLWVPFTKTEQDSLRFIQNSGQDPQNGTGLELGIWYKNQLVGCIGLHTVHLLRQQTSFGYWLGEEFQGNGIMTESVRALTRFCFEELHLHRIEIQAAAGNTASQRVPERLGFIHEGTLREAEYVDGKFLDVLVYGLVRRR